SQACLPLFMPRLCCVCEWRPPGSGARGCMTAWLPPTPRHIGRLQGPLGALGATFRTVGGWALPTPESTERANAGTRLGRRTAIAAAPITVTNLHMVTPIN